MVREMIKEIGNKSREFYEFVLPPIDMEMLDDRLVVIVDIPGFEKKGIKLSLSGNVLSIKAEKKKEDRKDTMICNQRPHMIDKRIRLPLYIKEGEEKVSAARYVDGVLTVTIPVSKSGKDISIE